MEVRLGPRGGFKSNFCAFLLGFILSVPWPLRAAGPEKLVCPSLAAEFRSKPVAAAHIAQSANQLKNSSLRLNQLVARAIDSFPSGGALGKDGSAFNQDTLHNLLIERKKHLLLAAKSGQVDILPALLNETTRERLGSHTIGCIEEMVSASGRLEVLAADSPGGASGSYEYFLTDWSGRRLNLLPLGGFPHEAISGSQILVRGFILDDSLIFDGRSGSTDGSAVHGGSRKLMAFNGLKEDARGAQKTLIILSNFQDTSEPDYGVEDALHLWEAVNYFYLQDSYGQTWFEGTVNPSQKADVVGWVTLPLDRTCDTSAVKNAAIEAVDPEVNFGNYSRLVLVAPFECPEWGGKGSVGKWTIDSQDGSHRSSIAWLKYHYLLKGVYLPTAIHELGHNFGLRHANHYECSDSDPTDPSTCTSVEYGDPFSIMGHSGNGGWLNSQHKELLGWLPEKHIVEVHADIGGEYILAPIDTMADQLRALKILRRNRAPLYLEYRRCRGFLDCPFSPYIGIGALVHMPEPGESGKTVLIGAGGPNPEEAPLSDGESFWIPGSQTLLSVETLNDFRQLRVRLLTATSAQISIDPILNFFNSVVLWKTKANAAPASVMHYYAIDDGKWIKLPSWRLKIFIPSAIHFAHLPSIAWARRIKAGEHMFHVKAVNPSGEEAFAAIKFSIKARTLRSLKAFGNSKAAKKKRRKKLRNDGNKQLRRALQFLPIP